MDLSGQRVLAYLQEDNTQRMLFRVRPLLSPQGMIAPEDIAAYRDNGYLRVAPDRKEQLTFKERMRELGSLCVLDLQDAAPGKVRPNRNYAPNRGESNRYIIYSDAIKALPQDMVYEVVAKEESRHAPLTPRYYVRSGGFITGPFSDAGQEGEGASQSLPPDCDRLFLVTMPDNQHRLFYWPELPDAPGSECAPVAEAPQAQPEAPVSVRSLSDLFFRRRQPLSAPQPGLKTAAAAAEEALRQAGFACDENQAIHLLLVFLLSQRLQLSSPVVADALTAGETMASLLGLKPLLSSTGEVPAGGEDQLLISPLAAASTQSRRQVIIAQAHSVSLQNQAAYALAPWPVVSVEAAESWLFGPPAPAAQSLLQLKQQLSQHHSELSAQVQAELSAWQRRLRSLDSPLPLALKRDMARYLRHAEALLPGHEAALGFAAASYVLPYALSKGVPEDALSDLFEGRPEALKLL